MNVTKPSLYLILPLTGPLMPIPLPPTTTLSPQFLAAVTAAATDGTAQAMGERIERNLNDYRICVNEEKQADFRRILRWLQVCCP